MTDKSPYQSIQEAGGIETTRHQRSIRPRRDKTVEGGLFIKMDKAVIRQFKMLCADKEYKQKEALAKALNLLFREHDLPAIADEGGR